MTNGSKSTCPSPDPCSASQTCALLHVSREGSSDRLLPGLRRLAALSMSAILLTLFPKFQFLMIEDDNVRGRVGTVLTSEILSALVCETDACVLVRREFRPGVYPQKFSRPGAGEKKKKLFHSGKSFALNKAAVERLRESGDAILQFVPVEPSLIWEDAWTLVMFVHQKYVVVEAGAFVRHRKAPGAAQQAMCGAENSDNGAQEPKNNFEPWFQMAGRDVGEFLSDADKCLHIQVGRHLQKQYEIQSATPRESVPQRSPAPVWWKGQVDIAKVILDRIVHPDVLGPLPEKFDNMDFRFLIPAPVSMEIQTMARIQDATRPGYGLNLDGVPPEAKILRFGSGFCLDEFDAFKEAVCQNAKTLYIVLVDECHIDMRPGESHDRMINDADLLVCENFLVVLVSATPYSNGFALSDRFALAEYQLAKAQAAEQTSTGPHNAKKRLEELRQLHDAKKRLEELRQLHDAAFEPIQLHSRTRIAKKNVIAWEPAQLEKHGGEYGWPYFGLKYFLKTSLTTQGKLRPDQRLEGMLDRFKESVPHRILTADYVCAMLQAALDKGNITAQDQTKYIESGFSELKEVWTVRKDDPSETRRIIDELLSPEKGRGPLQVIRLGSGKQQTSTNEAKFMEEQILQCSKRCGFSKDFAVILDTSEGAHWWDNLDDNFKDKLRGWNNRSLLKGTLTYGDLSGLPALLILVEKGKLGDTIPMQTLDMRLRKRKQEAYSLADLRQELARAAGRRQNEADVPSILVPLSLFTKLQACASECGDVIACKSAKFEYDTTRLSKSQGPYPHKPTRSNYDYDYGAEIRAEGYRQNSSSVLVESKLWPKPESVVWTRLGLTARVGEKGKTSVSGLRDLETRSVAGQLDRRRLLFHAIEQAGKTGVCLSLIQQLQQQFEDNTPPRIEVLRSKRKICWDDWHGWPHDDLWEHLQVDKLAGMIPDKGVQLQSGETTKLLKLAAPSAQKRLAPTVPGRVAPTEGEEDVDFELQPPGEFRARTWDETSKQSISHLPSPQLGRLDVPDCAEPDKMQPLVFSVPKSRFIQVNAGRVQKAQENESPRVVQDWVFRPSFDRWHNSRGMFNWWEMDSENKDEESLQLIVVGPGGRRNPHATEELHEDGYRFEVGEEFRAYRENWGRTHCIVQLPKGLQSHEYACAWIVQIAKTLSLPRIWIVPDDIRCFYQVIPLRTERRIDTAPVAAPRVLHQLAQQYEQLVNSVGAQSKTRCAMLSVTVQGSETLHSFQPMTPFWKGSSDLFLLNVELLQSQRTPPKFDHERDPNLWHIGLDIFAMQCSLQTNADKEPLMVVRHATFVAEKVKVLGGHLSLVEAVPLIQSIKPESVPVDRTTDLLLMGSGLSTATHLVCDGQRFLVTKASDQEVHLTINEGRVKAQTVQIHVECRGDKKTNERPMTFFNTPKLQAAAFTKGRLRISGSGFPDTKLRMQVRFVMTEYQNIDCSAHWKSESEVYCADPELGVCLHDVPFQVRCDHIELSMDGIRFDPVPGTDGLDWVEIVGRTENAHGVYQFVCKANLVKDLAREASDIVAALSEAGYEDMDKLMGLCKADHSLLQLFRSATNFNVYQVGCIRTALEQLQQSNSGEVNSRGLESKTKRKREDNGLCDLED
eukprot:TRINITY_DN3179_c0_g1_i17.p1 TRINITY_DN3179_c0_g1~~TRINITY_DN3179_c0_g1_i17.p1  ORF type:complete len:1615 (-),score=161.43 TRINITY_DN3179_c0_g1_i17:240-5084(-)